MLPYSTSVLMSASLRLMHPIAGCHKSIKSMEVLLYAKKEFSRWTMILTHATVAGLHCLRMCHRGRRSYRCCALRLLVLPAKLHTAYVSDQLVWPGLF